VSPKARLDLAMVARGLAKSREEAQRLILAGEVRIGDRVASKASEGVAEGAAISIGLRSRFVSRGGEKLDGALEAFGLDVSDVVAIDVGASTGGFTDCLLQRGARRVHAIDVGYGQLDWKLRQDPRVRVLERANVRGIDASVFGEPVGLAVVDVSFISLRIVLPKVVTLLVPPAAIVALVKPQFEVGKGKVGKGGVVRDPALHAGVVEDVRAVAAELRLDERGFVPSSLLGPAGNREFFLWWQVAAGR
jgi:23S rRNA (cytidine1920-2'-O)/16S rRNA (cytidine1409-2'-O)-methyltransferase